MLLIPTVAVAFTDVVTDSLMVEHGQPHGLTGRLQSVQWACMYGATMLTGVLGGWPSATNRQSLGFGICAVTAGVSLVLALTCIREPPRPEGELPLQTRLAAMQDSVFKPRFLAAAAFLFLWGFNPFSAAILQDYQVAHLKLGEAYYGQTISISAAGSVLACIAYGAYCPKLSMNTLVHLSILAGVLSTLLYLGLDGAKSGYVLAAITGFTYMTGSLVQFDLAARVCPAAAAGTVFSLLIGALQCRRRRRHGGRGLAAQPVRAHPRTARHVRRAGRPGSGHERPLLGVVPVAQAPSGLGVEGRPAVSRIPPVASNAPAPRLLRSLAVSDREPLHFALRHLPVGRVSGQEPERLRAGSHSTPRAVSSRSQGER